MKRTVSICILLALILILFAACSVPTAKVISTEDNPPPEFKYAVVEEADDYYLHKLDTWTTEDGIVIFDCPVCGTTIRVPEEKIIMYTKASLNSSWSDYVNVCSGEPNDWQDLLYN